MIFPNNSSGSDESVTEADQGMGLDQSMVLLEPNGLQVEDEQSEGNVWRLYFGSSYESESGNSLISRLVSTNCTFTEFVSIYVNFILHEIKFHVSFLEL